MQAKDIMTSPVVTIAPDAPIDEIAKVLLKRRISAVPVVGPDDRLLGIVSEGDLIRRPELGTERHRSWWLSLMAEPSERASEYVKTHGRLAKDVMTAKVVTIAEDTPVHEIAETLEHRGIKRVPVVRKGKPVGIVSRANLLQGLAARQKAPAAVAADDRSIREAVCRTLQDDVDISFDLVNVVVSGGVVHLWGGVNSASEKKAVRIAAESVPGVTKVEDHVAVLPLAVRTGL